MGDGFLALNPSFFASGDGSATYRGLTYKALA
jgi:hypothetical protein